MAFRRILRGEETVSLAHLLQHATGTVWLTRSGKTRVMRLDVIPTAEYSNGGSLLVLDAGDRPVSRLDDSWPTGSLPATVFRSGFVLPQGPIGVWNPRSSDRYRLTLTWGVA